MWQILLGIYIIIVLVSVLILWSSLVVAKRTDRNSERTSQSASDFAFDASDRRINRETIELVSLSRLNDE